MISARRLAPISLLVAAVGCDHETPPPNPPPAPPPTVVQAPPPAPLPAPPVLRLPATNRPTSYTVAMRMSPKEETFHGRVDVQVAISQPTSVVWMHAGDNLNVIAAHVNGKHARVTRANEDMIGIQTDAPITGHVEIKLMYAGKLPNRDGRGAYRQEERGEAYIFTQFESTDARRAFPCFDEPGFKAPFTLSIDAPADQLVFANTPEVSSKPSVKQGWKTTTFAPTKPLPSYLVAFAVGPFEIVDGGKAGKNNTPIRIIVPKGRSADAKYAAAQTGKVLATLENYFDMPYPFEKLDHIAVPQKGGAMENPGLITYGTATILGKGDEKSTRLEHGYLSIAAHELGHLWFGDLVTTSWWDDTWLNEAFATWISAKIVDTMHPEWETSVSRAESANRVMGQDALMSTRRIRQPIETKHDIVTAFDNITYLKGGAVIGMMESWVGAEQFRKAVHGYLTKHAYGNATSQEFLADMGAQMDAPHKDFAAAFSSFLDQPGTPMITSTLKCDQNTPRLTLSQKRFLPEGSKADAKMQWLVPFCASYPGGKTCTLLKDDVDMKLDAKTCPPWVNPNADGTGYYRAFEEAGAEPKLLDNTKLSITERVAVMGDMVAFIKNGALTDNVLLAKEGAIVTEGNPHLVTMAAGYTGNLEEAFVTDASHAKYAAFVKKTFGPTAAKLGWAPKADDKDATRLERPSVVSLAARYDDALAAQAQKLSLAWLDDKKAIDFDMVPAVLDAGARKADKAYWDKLHEAAKKAEDRLERNRLISAMGHAQDPALAKANLDVALSQEFDPRESITLVFRVADEPKNRQLAWDFVKANYDKLVAPLPWRSGAALTQVAGHFCDETHRAEAEAFFKTKGEKFEGGPRIIAQLLEDMSLCIAERPKREKNVSDFLGK